MSVDTVTRPGPTVEAEVRDPFLESAEDAAKHWDSLTGEQQQVRFEAAQSWFKGALRYAGVHYWALALAADDVVAGERAQVARAAANTEEAEAAQAVDAAELANRSRSHRAARRTAERAIAPHVPGHVARREAKALDLFTESMDFAELVRYQQWMAERAAQTRGQTHLPRDLAHSFYRQHRAMLHQAISDGIALSDAREQVAQYTTPVDKEVALAGERVADLQAAIAKAERRLQSAQEVLGAQSVGRDAPDKYHSRVTSRDARLQALQAELELATKDHNTLRAQADSLRGYRGAYVKRRLLTRVLGLGIPGKWKVDPVEHRRAALERDLASKDIAHYRKETQEGAERSKLRRSVVRAATVGAAVLVLI